MSTEISADLKLVVGMLLNVVKKNLQESKNHLPFAFIDDGEGSFFIQPLLLNEPQGQYDSAMAVKNLCEQFGSRFVVTLTEAYTLPGLAEALDYTAESDMYESLSQHPDAVKCIHITLETSNEGNYFASAEIFEDNSLGEYQLLPYSHSVVLPSILIVYPFTRRVLAA